MKTNWLAPVLGVVVVAGGLMAATTLLDLEREVRAQESFSVTLDRVYADERLCAALKVIHDGKTEVGTQRLDRLLCESILRLNNGLASADEPARAYVEESFRRIALLRPKPAVDRTGGSNSELSEDQAAAERILARVSAGVHVAQTQ